MNLPRTRVLTGAVMKARRGRASVETSIEFVTTNRLDLEYFEDIEDFICSSGPTNERYRDAFQHHLVVIRQSLARVLWAHEIFIGASVLDALLFRAIAHTEDANPVEWVINYVRSQGLHNPGLIVYPLHSLGVLGAGAFRWLTRADVRFISDQYGLGITPQTNDWERSWRFIEDARREFGIRRGIPRELLEHWSRSRPITWLTRNPLMIVRCRSFPGSYFENQALLVVRLQFATSLWFMFASLQPGGVDRTEPRNFSSSVTNNFQTLDLRHYLVFFPSVQKRGMFDGQCVPMQGRRGALAELSDLAVEFDPRYWRTHRAQAGRIHAAVAAIQAGFLRFSIGRYPNSVEARIYRKIFDALVFFRRSFRRSDLPDEACVNLAIAFEALLSDHFEHGIVSRLQQRLAAAVGAIPQRSAFVAALSDVYAARSRVVHQGERDVAADLALARRAFTYAVLGVALRLPRAASASMAHPMADLLDDPA